MKKEEIMEKLKKAEFVAGTGKITEKAEKELETDFIPDVYDKVMGKVFDEKYYDCEDENLKAEEKAVKENPLEEEKEDPALKQDDDTLEE